MESENPTLLDEIMAKWRTVTWIINGLFIHTFL